MTRWSPHPVDPTYRRGPYTTLRDSTRSTDDDCRLSEMPDLRYLVEAPCGPSSGALFPVWPRGAALAPASVASSTMLRVARRVTCLAVAALDRALDGRRRRRTVL